MRCAVCDEEKEGHSDRWNHEFKPDYIGKTTCNLCGERFPSYTHEMFRHMRTKHPEIWDQTLKKVEEDNNPINGGINDR